MKKHSVLGRRIIIALVLAVIVTIVAASNTTANNWYLQHEEILNLVLWWVTGIGITLAVLEKRTGNGTLFRNLLILCIVSSIATAIIIAANGAEEWIAPRYSLLMFAVWLVSGVVLTLVLAKTTGRAY